VGTRIPVLRGSGTGRTPLSAFHAALVDVGLAHYNLVRLSSSIPPRTGVDGTGTAAPPAGAWGDRLYCVYADQRAVVPGSQAWAGIGWAHRRDGFGGLFVEHEGDDEKAVLTAIRDSIGDLIATAEQEFTEPRWVLNGVTCVDDPVCSLVIAPYEAAAWGDPSVPHD
jgi:arginine decarboxylase